MIVRVELITGDARQGRYIGHDDSELTLHDGRIRRIPLRMIADIIEPAQFESCLTEPDHQP